MIKRVAIIGYAFRFPGTDTCRYWQDLLAGRNLVTEVAPERWARDPFLHPNKNHPGASYTFAAGSIGDIAGFDAGFFGISPREAALMDPQQRLLLEMSWEALENAGIQPSTLRGSRCGVFIGIASADYSYRLADDLAVIDASVATGNTASIAANRLSYCFDLRGPSMAIDTACSSALVAFHQACCSILSGETVQALTGGISLHLHPYGFITFSKAAMLSRRGRCRVFDAAADGYVRSEGGGVFFLKDYEQALADHNPILAVVAATAVNADGRKAGLTVPNPDSQAALLEQTYARAGIDPAALDYLEAHGTGTMVGDPVEAQAIGRALGKHRHPDTPLLIGSVKGNLGHLEAASGVAGLVKALHCLRHRTVPATIGVETPHPGIPFPDLRLEVVTENRPLKPDGRLTVGVNSFGFGGANAHVILQSREQPVATAGEQPLPTTPLPIILSAKNEQALRGAARDFADLLDQDLRAPLYEVAYNAAFRREWHGCRAVVHGADRRTVAGELRQFADNTPGHQVHSGAVLPAPSGPAFVYSGNGAQWEGMGRRLLAEAPLFKESVQQIDTHFRPLAGYSLADELAGTEDAGRYRLAERAQPALFALQVGITQMLRHQGIEPVAVAGHSVGEVAAAWAAGILTLADAVEVIYHRSRLQGMTKGKGQMTAVGLGREAMVDLLAELDLAPALVIAGSNSSRGVTIAGAPELLTQLETHLAHRAVFYRRLDLDYAFHSPAMDPIEDDVRQALAHLRPQPARIPFVSTVTGAPVDGRELDATYWWRNIRQPVRFGEAIDNLRATGTTLFLEVGPHPILRNYLHDCLRDAGTEGLVIGTLKRGDDGADNIRRACAQAVIAGAPVDWARSFPVPVPWLRLPNYPWQRERYWHPITPEANGLLDRRKVHPLLGFALSQHERTWENRIDTAINPNLADHVVGETTVFPGTGFAELALAAALCWLPGPLAEIEELEIRTPLVLSGEHAACLRLHLDEQDGGIRIKGRRYGDQEPWTTHAVGRILREPGDLLLAGEPPVLPARPPDFNGASHAMLTREVGLAYGPAFQCIECGWTEKNSALAILTIPDEIGDEMGEMYLHPALLDCTFQLLIQILKENLNVHEGITYVPVKMGRIVFRKHPARPHVVRATLLYRTAQALRAEFTLFDTKGTAIAVIKEARFHRMRVRKNAVDRVCFLDYHCVPRPVGASVDASPVIPFKKVLSALSDVARRAALSGSHRRYSEEVEPLLDSLCSQWTIEALQQLAADGNRLSFQKILVCRAANPEMQPFFEYLLSLAREDQAIVPTPEGWDIAGQDDRASAQDIWNSLIADYPDFFQIIHAVGRVGMHLATILEGRRTPRDAGPGSASLAALTFQVLGAEGKQKIGAALRQLIVQGINQLPEGRRLTMVEIGTRSPYYAGDAAAVMDGACCDYLFAGTSEELVEDIPRLQERFPRIDIRLINGAAEREAPVPPCQLAIVTLDFTGAETAIRALGFARACLAPGGTLIVVGLHPSRWIDFVFGAQHRQPHPQDSGPWRSDQRPALFWQQQLQQLHFGPTTLLELSPDTLAGPYLLLAQPASAMVPAGPVRSPLPRSWVLLADPDGLSAQLSDQLTKRLQTRGDLVVQSCAATSRQLQALLEETTASYGQLDGIVYLAGIAPFADQADGQTVVERQVTRCAMAAAILQACESAQTQTTCWLITAGVGRDLLPRSPEEPAAAVVLPSDAALWGFGRTMMNEAANIAVRLVDLDHPLMIETAALALEREFEQPDDEREILLSRRGARYAPRLDLVPRPERTIPVPQQIEAPVMTLGFPFPGKLRNLRWETRPGRQLADQDIEVAVQATGLNFRDLMYTLGLLTSESLEYGFAGPTLGLEFSGIVRRVGKKACPFKPGDRVVGFGPASFSNRVVTQASAITHLPPGLSFEAAATIPCTFFTVYYALHHLARLQPGEKVLIHCAAGGVGIAAVQLAKWLGAEIFVTAGSDEKRDFLHLLGVEHIFDSRSLAFADQILRQTEGEGVDVVLNSLSGDAIDRNFRVLKPFGRFLELGKRDYYENTKIGLRPFRNNISYFGIDTDQLMQARPDLARLLFTEVMDLFAEGVLHPLPYHLFEAEDILDAFRFMQQARHIGKIVVTYRNGINHVCSPRAVVREPLQLAADAAYLVTGGLGGFGLRTARWLVDKGARHLVLISRRGPGAAEAKTELERMRKQGVTVLAASCDVTDKAALATLLREVATTMPPLRGIVHAATVIDDGLIRTMAADQIRRVLGPKALGAYHLHDLTRDTPLDFFVLFSSATTLFGNPGQGNYVAANACLEGLARNRRAAGLPATCARWGAIEDVGFLARNKKIKDALQSRMGGAPLPAAGALAILEDMLVADRSGLGVMELDWGALSRFLPSATSPKFAALARHAGEGGRNEERGATIVRMLEELPEADFLSACVVMLQQEVGEILRIAPEKVDPSCSLYDMGLDSLMGVELIGALESLFGVRLPPMVLSQAPTLEKLAAHLLQQLKGNGEAQEGAGEQQELLLQARQLAEQHGAEVSAESLAQLAEELGSPDPATTHRIIH